MGLTVTQILEERNGKVSEEALGKLSEEERAKVLEKEKIKQQEKNKALTFVNSPDSPYKNYSDEKRIALIKEEVNKTFNLNIPKIPLSADPKTDVILEHQKELGFIFIGDSSQYKNDPDVKIKSPKISMAVGGALASGYNPKDKTINYIDPKQKTIIGTSAQLSLYSLTDVDTTGILPNKVDTLKKRSSVHAEADALELYGNEIVLIRSLGRPYKMGTGAITMGPGGVHIVSGQEYKDPTTGKVTEITAPEPMVLGNKLSKVLSEIVVKISDINSVLIAMNEDLVTLKTALVAHVHIATGPGAPVSPSPDLAIAVAPTLATNTLKNIANGYSNLLNLEILKMNGLSPLSEQKFLSEFNRVN